MLSNAIMEETEQFNIRVSKALIYDLEFVSQSLRINKSDWVRFKLAEIVQKEKETIIKKIEIKFIDGLISEEEFKQSAGIFPFEGLKELRDSRRKERQIRAL